MVAWLSDEVSLLQGLRHVKIMVACLSDEVSWLQGLRHAKSGCGDSRYNTLNLIVFVIVKEGHFRCYNFSA